MLLAFLMLIITMNYRLVDGTDCSSRTFTNSSGTLTSPNYPENYPDSLNCSWNIIVVGAGGIELTVDVMAVEHPDHFHDRLEIYSSTGRQLKKFTTTGKLKLFEHQLRLQFVTDGSGVDKGFSMHWQAFCQIPPTPENSRVVSLADVWFGQTVVFECVPGYSTDDSTFIVCQQDMRWSPSPHCILNEEERKAILCPRPQTPYYARLVSITGTRFGQTALYECLPGYITNDTKYIICQMNGEWSAALDCTVQEEVTEGPETGEQRSSAKKSGPTSLVVLVSCTFVLLTGIFILMLVLLRQSTKNKNCVLRNETTVNNGLYSEMAMDDSGTSLGNIRVCEQVL
ncbi:seizure protein 6 homolog [Watersipora subatra]|uniref:seizure protein 6 homolog n=1 Tax=Watersipora subatra TaxID=2589382 RepID=UPI00355C520E